MTWQSCLHRARSVGRRRRPSAGRKLFLETLEDRTVPSGGGLVPSLVALGGATPRPIPLPASVLPLTGTPALSGPDAYLNLTGPATNVQVFGNEPNAITDFTGNYGGAAVMGDGTDGEGNTLYWIADVRFMQGTYRAVNGHLYYRTFMEV